jgi:hypothetical protein
MAGRVRSASWTISDLDHRAGLDGRRARRRFARSRTVQPATDEVGEGLAEPLVQAASRVEVVGLSARLRAAGRGDPLISGVPSPPPRGERSAVSVGRRRRGTLAKRRRSSSWIPSRSLARRKAGA